ncbi:FixH family protein [Engelhardtia mirabilis]|uniref:YtkA-like domain-containing protein n=1 Tax=Engelhardtia mirabilis TaxID=2528011 RepID=A0A518BRG5_9BACT|nr:hypothetical protein Pla133_46840 [Planctomycetes bacterium Pla133]QDV03890.1 hypothetical protein Pla86_46820 [Planctomycetes bacterium Pla86]
MTDFRPLLGVLSIAIVIGCAGPGGGGGAGSAACACEGAECACPGDPCTCGARRPESMPSTGLLTADAEGWHSGLTLDGATRVRWRGVEGETPTNRLFALELELLDGAEPVTGAEVGVSAFMPDHGHGMNYVPQTTELGAGHYRVEGMLLHMPGFWQLHVDVVRGGIASRATFDLDL